MQAKRGFTLVEILTVMAVIAALSGTLLSVLGTSKGRAKIVSCATNLNQLGKALILYSGDNDDSLPPLLNLAGGKTITNGLTIEANPWGSMLMPYVKTNATFYCPEDPLAHVQAGASAFARVDHRQTSYAHASWLEKIVDRDGHLNLQMGDVEEPAAAPHLLDDGIGVNDRNRTIALPHDGRANVLFFDGHVARPATDAEPARK